MLIETLSVPLNVTNPTANVTVATVTEPVPTTTKPSGDGVIALGDGGQHASTAVKLVPFGVGANLTTFTLYAYGWQIVPGSLPGTPDLWVPVLLARLTACTLNTAIPGVLGTNVPATNFFCSSITIGTGNSGISLEVVSPGTALNEIAHAILDTKGSRLLETRFAMGGSATSANALWGKM